MISIFLLWYFNSFLYLCGWEFKRQNSMSTKLQVEIISCYFLLFAPTVGNSSHKKLVGYKIFVQVEKFPGSKDRDNNLLPLCLFPRTLYHWRVPNTIFHSLCDTHLFADLFIWYLFTNYFYMDW